MAAATPLSLKGRALKALSLREHSRIELRRKLAPHAQDEAELDPLLDELERRGFLSETRHIASVIHRRAPAQGLARIRQELRQRGAPAELCGDALAALQDSEQARALALWQRRYGQPPADAREAARQSRFLMSRGFAPELVRQLLRQTGTAAPLVPEDDTDSGDGPEV